MPRIKVIAARLGIAQNSIVNVSEERYRRWIAKGLGIAVDTAVSTPSTDRDTPPAAGEPTGGDGGDSAEQSDPVEDDLDQIDLPKRTLNELRQRGLRTRAAVAAADRDTLIAVWGINEDNVAAVYAAAGKA